MFEQELNLYWKKVVDTAVGSPGDFMEGHGTRLKSLDLTVEFRSVVVLEQV